MNISLFSKISSCSMAIRLFTLCMSLFLCGVMSAKVGDTFEQDDLAYTVLTESGNTGTVSVRAASTSVPDDLTIPSEVTNSSITYKVTETAEGAFENLGIESISLPSGLTFINRGAFANCTHLTEITIPETVTSIESYVFQGCSSLRKIRLPYGLTSIGDNDFDGCSLVHVNLPSTLTYIGGVSPYELIMPQIGNFKDADPFNLFYLGDDLPSYGSMKPHILYLKPSVYRKLKASADAKKWFDNIDIYDKIEFTINQTNRDIPTYTATMCRDFDVDLRHTNDNLPLGIEPLKAYIVKDVDVSKNVIELQEIKYVPSRLRSNDEGYKGYDEYVGVLLKGTPGYTYYYTIGEEDYTKGKDGQMTLEKALALSNASVPTSSAKFVGCNEEKHITGEETVDGVTYKNYGLKDNEFQPFSYDGTIGYNKAYLRIPVASGSSAKQNVTLVFHDADGTTSSVSSVSLSKTRTGDNYIYDLQGMKISAPVKGKVYIQNGKKYLHK